ncbi:CDC45-like protein [Microthyrium microscopicum]|uniref:CDC45-like protein n=1 Tax=Microthyrium microscopicum TaxID=703497 RepID=A0A6A6USA6_9PEZI|nr:CDC45-like protein [Microthyrium microscopicum]
MYLPRSLISHLYNDLVRSRTSLSPSVLVLVSLEPDALCACRILTSLFKNDYVQHNIKPIAGYADLARVGEEVIRPMRTTEGGSGGVVVCLGVGGLVDLETILGLEVDDDGNGGMGGLDVWVFDARRPWNLANVFGMQSRVEQVNGEAVSRIAGVEHGKILQTFKPGEGGIIVFDDGDIEEELRAEKEAYCALAEMPDVDEEDDGDDSDDSDAGSDHDADDMIPESGQPQIADSDESDKSSIGEKRKRRSSPQFSDDDHEDSDPEEGTPNKRRRSNSSSPLPSSSRPAARSLMILSKPNDQQVGQHAEASTHGQPSAKKLRKQLLKLKRKHDSVLRKYYNLGASYSEPISSLMWNLASELGRDSNDLLWLAIVGVSSGQISGRTASGIGLSPISTSGTLSSWTKDRGERIRAIFRDEVRRLNPTDLRDLAREVGGDTGIIPTRAYSPTDNSIRLTPEPRFLLVRHWSLYDSMLHSPYLSAKLHIWSDAGKRKMHKLLAKMGVSIQQSKQNYQHMDMEIKRGLGEKLVRFAPQYGLEGLVPPETRLNSKEGWGFVRCWGWKACLSAIDSGIILGAILEVGDMDVKTAAEQARNAALQSAAHSGTSTPSNNQDAPLQGAKAPTPAQAQLSREESLLRRFWSAYDALGDVMQLTSAIPTAQHLHRAILRTGTSLIEKRQIRHLRAFRMAVVKEGPDVALFTHPGALVKLALWLAEAISEMDSLKGARTGELVMAGLDEARGVYVVVGLGGGSAVAKMKEREARVAERKKERERTKAERKAAKDKKRQQRKDRLAALGESDAEDEEDDETESEASESEEESEDEEEAPRGKGLNRFGNAFQEVIEETGVRVKVDSFEHCVVEIRKEDLSGFLESLCMKAVVG